MTRSVFFISLWFWCGTAYPQVDALFEPWDKYNTPGAAVAVIHHGQVVHKRGYGLASLEHQVGITSRTVFDAASVSKQFGAFAIALLVDQGRLSMDDDIHMYIPELGDFGHTITIRHLIHHTSGLRDWPGVLAMAGRSMEDVISFDEIITTTRNQKTLNFAPGERYSYSNTGYNLLALVVERISGMSFRKFTERHIFRPLGMLHTYFQDDHEEIVRNRAYGYRPSWQNYRRVGNSLMALGSSSLHTTIDDLILWAQNFSKQDVGSATVHALMETRGVLTSGETLSYAFGQVLGTYRGLRTLSHTGSWAGFRSALMRFPDHDLVVIVLSNTTDMNAGRMAQLTAETYLEPFMHAVPTAPATASVSFEPDDYVGVYEISVGQVVQLTNSQETLQARIPPGAPATLRAVGQDSFYVLPWNTTLTFERNGLGHVTHIEAFGQSAPRVEPVKLIDLNEYTGPYYSLELGVSYVLMVRNDTLMAMGPEGAKITMMPAVRDMFLTDQWYMPLIRFQRGEDGRLTRFEASNARSLRVEFRR